MKRAFLFVLAALLAAAFCLPAWSGGTQEGKAAAPAAAAPATPTQFKEAPMLADMVKSGTIPSVDKRLPPKDFMVVTPIEKVGKYGGTVKVFAVDPNPWNDWQWGAGASDGLFRMSRNGANLEPGLAKAWKLADDYRSFLIYLREGVKWSDGQPLDADDLMFWFMDMTKDPKIPTWSTFSFDVAEKVDDYTVNLKFLTPYPAITASEAQWPSWVQAQPKHYLQKWHLKYNPDAEKLAKDDKFDTWQASLQSHYWWAPQKDTKLPKFNAWVLKETTTTNQIWERNPYYWKVDTAGNQLPYIDKVMVSIIDKELYNLKVISGEADYAYYNMSFSNFTLFKENEKQGNYHVVLMPGASGSDITVAFNLNSKDTALRRLFQDVRFRQAMSVAINRDEMNQVLYSGKGVPRQHAPLPSVSYYKEAWGKSFAQFDPQMANRLLDEMGLTKRDGNGFRLGLDGKSLDIAIEYSEGTAQVDKGLELIASYWGAVGIKATPKFLDLSFFREREGTNEHMARVGSTAWADEITNYAQGARGWAGHGDIINWANVWGRWWTTTVAIEDLQTQLAKATDDQAKTKLQANIKAQQDALAQVLKEMPDGAAQPPADYIQVNRWFQDRGKVPMGSPQYKEISQKIYDFWQKALWSIGTVGMIPKVMSVRNNLKNAITAEYINRVILPAGTTDMFDQYYFE